MDPNQNKPWYPNGAPIPGQEQGPQAPPFPPAATAQHGLPPQQPYVPPTRPVETQPQQPYPPAGTPQQMAVPQPQQSTTPQYSIDYLNQIAPAAKKPGLDNRIFLFLIGGGLLLAAIVGFFSLSGGNGPTEKMMTMAARLETLQTVTEKAQKNIKSNKLRNTNSSLNIFLTNANTDMVEPLMTNGVDIKKINKEIEAAEKGEDLTKKLEDARLNAVFDRIYAREMSYQLSTLESLMGTIYHQTKSKSLKDFLNKTDENIAPVIKQLDAFNPTTAND